MKVISIPLTESGADALYNEIQKDFGKFMSIEFYYPERIMCKILDSRDFMETIIKYEGKNVNMAISCEGSISVNIEGDYTLGELELVYLLTQLIYKLKEETRNGNCW